MSRPGAVFIGFQSTETPSLRFRLYNITGDHRLRGSTVTVATLVANHIPVPDLCASAVAAELMAFKTWMNEEVHI